MYLISWNIDSLFDAFIMKLDTRMLQPVQNQVKDICTGKN